MTLTCVKCPSQLFFVVITEAGHAKAECSHCGAYLRFLPQGEETNLADEPVPFGKHRGKRVSELPKDYLAWGAVGISNKRWRGLFAKELERRGA